MKYENDAYLLGSQPVCICTVLQTERPQIDRNFVRLNLAFHLTFLNQKLFDNFVFAENQFANLNSSFS